MKLKIIRLCWALVFLWMFAIVAQAQQTAASSPVPRLVRYSAIATDPQGKHLGGSVGATFALYKDEQGGAALWVETQNVTADSSGRYTVQLGASKPEGLPAELFASGEARWLGVSINGQAELPRVLLLSVPYALKALDAETVGGKPASAFMMAPSFTGDSDKTAPPTATVTGSGTADFVPRWTSTSTLGNSNIFETVGGNVGIATTTPTARLDVKGTAHVRNTLTLFPSGTSNTVAVSGTSFKISNTGQVTFVAGQNFPGTGTVSSVASGSGLTGGPITTSGTLSVATGGITNSMLQNPSLTVTANSPLSGGGAVTLGGSVNLGLTTSCSSGQILKWNGSAWACAADNNSGGSVTSVGSGLGLTGGPITTTGTLSIDVSQVPQLTANNTFSGNQTIGGNLGIGATPTNPLTVATNSTFTPVLIQSSSNFGTWTALSNTSTGGHTWNLISAGSADAEGAGNLAITDLTGHSTIWLEGNVSASTVEIGTTSTTGMLNAAANSPSVIGISAVGGAAAQGSFMSGTSGIETTGGVGDTTSGDFTNGGPGLVASGGFADGFGGAGGTFTGASSNFAFDGDGVDATTVDGVVNGNLAGNFQGNLNVSGAIFAGSKDFKIDHPLDPANKYLYHASVESSEMMNIYTGNVTLEAGGEATIQLPDWFEAVNGDFRYQLTCVGGFAPVFIAQKIYHNSFRIAGGTAGLEVSWQVTGVRQDAYAKANPLIVEQPKSARERGYYIHPELYGAPEEKGVEWARNPAWMKQVKNLRTKQSAHNIDNAGLSQ